MDKQETRRRNPVARIALVAVLILIVFEALVIFGALELNAQAVAKYAPWAYEPFLRLVGEHPESTARQAVVEESDEAATDESTTADVTGLDPSAIPALIETNETVPGPVAAPEDELQEVVPVG